MNRLNKFVLAGLCSVMAADLAFADSVALKSDYVGESESNNKLWLTVNGNCAHFAPGSPALVKNPRIVFAKSCQVKYLNPTERQAYKLTWDDKAQVWKNAKGEVFDTNVARNALSPKPTITAYDLLAKKNMGAYPAIWVMDSDNNLYVSVSQSPGQFHHSSFLAGGNVQAAGQIIITKGKITAINNASGHYKPTEQNLMAALTNLKHFDPAGVWCYRIVSNKDSMAQCPHVEEPETLAEVDYDILNIDKQDGQKYLMTQVSEEELGVSSNEKYLTTSEKNKYTLTEDQLEYIPVR